MDKLLRQQNKITFDRLCYRVCELFRNDDARIQKYLDQYSYVYVDEFQDTDPLQWEFVQSFIKKSSVILVGDIRQAIYQFRGSDSSIIKSILSDTSWTIIKLETNYRSTPQICNYANSLLSMYSDNTEKLILKSVCKDGPQIQFISKLKFESNIDEYLASPSSCAIIARTNSEVEHLSRILTLHNIQYSTKHKLKNKYIAGCALDETYRQEVLISLLRESDKSNLLRNLYLNNKFDIDSYLHSKFPNIFEEILNIEECDEFWQLKLLYDAGELNLYDISDSDLNISESNLYIGTIHSVKGLEFDKVIVYGVNSESFKVVSSEELMNLFYVACTRPKLDLLIVYDLQNSLIHL